MCVPLNENKMCTLKGYTLKMRNDLYVSLKQLKKIVQLPEPLLSLTMSCFTGV